VGGPGVGGGALLVDKPSGPTSHDVVARARRTFHTRAVGHTGTLDPFASGLLMLVLGNATRLARWAERRRKTYRAVARLGQTTTTDDRTGEVLAEHTGPHWPTREEVELALAGLVGAQDQQPPAFSAKRIDGVRSYRLARKRSPVSPAAAPVMVHGLDLVEYRVPFLTFVAEVGPGTYLRAIARDLGLALEVGAHLTELRRERIGSWRVEEAFPLAELRAETPLLPAELLVADLPRVELTPDEVRAVRHGRDVVREPAGEGEGAEAALVGEHGLVGIGRRAGAGWHPAVVLHDAVTTHP